MRVALKKKKKKKRRKPEDVKEKNEKKNAFKSRFNESRILLMDLKRQWRRRKNDEYFTTPFFFFFFLFHLVPVRNFPDEEKVQYFPIILPQ